MPKRGFRRKDTGHIQPAEVINVRQLNRFNDGERVTVEALRARHLIGAAGIVKLLGDGELTKRVTVVVHRASDSAKEKVAKAGGAVELIDKPSA